jgi:hypothetical protein
MARCVSRSCAGPIGSFRTTLSNRSYTLTDSVGCLLSLCVIWSLFRAVNSLGGRGFVCILKPTHSLSLTCARSFSPSLSLSRARSCPPITQPMPTSTPDIARQSAGNCLSVARRLSVALQQNKGATFSKFVPVNIFELLRNRYAFFIGLNRLVVLTVAIQSIAEHRECERLALLVACPFR